MKSSRIIAILSLAGVFVVGAWLLMQITTLTLESDDARNAQADRLGLQGEERDRLLVENEAVEESQALLNISDYFYDRLLYPTYQFDNAWLVEARQQNAAIQEALPAGRAPAQRNGQALNLSGEGFTFLGPNPLQSNGCTGCYQYGLVQGRVNAIAINPQNTTIAYLGEVGGGVFRTTNCCSSSTTWENVTDQDDLLGIAIDDITLDPSNPNIV